MLRAGLDREGVAERILDELDVFIDKIGFEKSGRVKDILTHARRSAFLFVFVGKKYSRSAWCAQELAAFADVCGSLDQAIDRTWTVVLEKEALWLVPEGGATEASVRLRSLLETGIQNRFFGDDGRAIHAFNLVGRDLSPTYEFVDRCRPIIDDVVYKLCARLNSGPQPPTPPPAPVTTTGPREVLIAVERNPEDEVVVRAVIEFLGSAFQAVLKDLRDEMEAGEMFQSVSITFDFLDWRVIEDSGSVGSEHAAFVIMDGAKDLQALIAQVSHLRELLWRSRSNAMLSMWVIPPRRSDRFKPTGFTMLHFNMSANQVECQWTELKDFMKGLLRSRPEARAVA